MELQALQGLLVFYGFKSRPFLKFVHFLYYVQVQQRWVELTPAALSGVLSLLAPALEFPGPVAVQNRLEHCPSGA